MTSRKRKAAVLATVSLLAERFPSTFFAVEGRRLGMRYLWAPVVASLTVGVSLGLPLFLYLRQSRLEQAS